MYASISCALDRDMQEPRAACALALGICHGSQILMISLGCPPERGSRLTLRSW